MLSIVMHHTAITDEPVLEHSAEQTLASEIAVLAA